MNVIGIYGYDEIPAQMSSDTELASEALQYISAARKCGLSDAVIEQDLHQRWVFGPHCIDDVEIREGEVRIYFYDWLSDDE
ncbi:hypothetical protein [Fodinicurvata sediminis]|uniref:hypothetical protein n=1 Tax=Fodinicurvata sediminis TaxID=1121832 RepID=UPI0003B6452C|nr:hypothetical protein [Fodinicurvata sediminis]